MGRAVICRYSNWFTISDNFSSTIIVSNGTVTSSI